MKAIVSFGMTSGLGDSYGGMYRAYIAHEYLKELGYEITTYVNIGLNPYKMNDEDRSIFKRVFQLDKFDNLNIILNEFNNQSDTYPKDYELIFDNSGIFQVYVDKKIDVEYQFNLQTFLRKQECIYTQCNLFQILLPLYGLNYQNSLKRNFLRQNSHSPNGEICSTLNK
jgi:hypothetical protein